ncbi:hypothetical protein PHMEG_00033062 [Phytophthora megakarya]|uniref:DUF6570 domain-containing protein n=1 Tax=Phytophthora megakarya TaxID=4795 RepID=A0A225UVM4_9STRA|nr:hypothetical protein PHMEG_00033062 [Phytophthora megakarya]
MFSLASGHDYGRSVELPKLNVVPSNCVAPARCFGLEFSLSRKTCSDPAVCFPSSGPQSLTKILPATYVDRTTRVTFIGSSERWRAQKHCYRRLYELASVTSFEWLSVLKDTHSYFRRENIEIDDSHTQMEKLNKLQELIESDVIVNNVDALHAVDDAVNTERFGDDATCNDGTDELLIHQSAALQPAQSQTDKGRSAAIDAMMEAIGMEENLLPFEEERFQ